MSVNVTNSVQKLHIGPIQTCKPTLQSIQQSTYYNAITVDIPVHIPPIQFIN